MILDAGAKKQIDACITPGAIKDAYLDGIDKAANEPEAKQFHSDFRKPHIRQGAVVADLLPDEGLGFLANRDVFVKKLSSDFGMSPARFDALVTLWVEYYQARVNKTKPTEQQRLAAKTFLMSTLPTRNDNEAWLFRNPERSADAFDSLVDEWLPKRLGLDLNPGEIRLTLGFFARNVEAIRQPRFLDASWGYLPFWEAGGRTRPLAGTPADKVGLEEVVAVPPILKDLASPVQEITVKP